MTHQAVSLAKRNNVWVARECAKLAREIHGANGIVNEYPIMRHLMNIESVYTYEGTHDIHTLVLGAVPDRHSGLRPAWGRMRPGRAQPGALPQVVPGASTV